MKAPLPEDEAARLDALREYGILDTESEAAFDDLTQLAAFICGTPIALISLIDDCRQWFKAKVGLEATETPRDFAFCAHAILRPDDTLVVPDTLDDERFATNPLVTGEPHIRFYAGAPLNTSEGYSLGTLCVIDQVPRQLSPAQVQALRALSRQVISQLELRRSLVNLTQTTAELQQAEQERLRLLAQEQLARSESETARNRVTTILESITDAFFTLDQEWRFTYLNQQAELLLHRTREELLGQVIWDEFPDTVGSIFYREYHKAVAEQVSVEFEAFYPPLNAWSEVHAYPSQAGLSVYFRDVNQRKQTEQTLQESEERFHQAFENAAIGMALVSLDGHWLQVNRSLAAMVGYSEAELLNTTFQAITHPDDLTTDLDQMRQVLTGQIDSYQLEKRYIHKLGQLIWALLSVSLVHTQQGQPLYFVAQIEDVTERKRAEAEVQRQNLRSQLFAEVSLKIRQSLQLEDILRTTVIEVQRFLQADRVLLFQLRSDGSGTVVQEAVVSGYPVTLGQDMADPCFHEGYLNLYRQGRIGAIADIEQAGIAPCYVEFLRQLGVKANLVVPIFIRSALWGLLIAHQCAHSRQWTDFETQFLKQLANQIGTALSQAQLLEQEIQQRQELARSQEELQAMSNALESAVEGIAQLDVQGRYVMVNRAYASMIGYQPEELLGLGWQETVHVDDLGTARVAYQRMLSEGKAEMEVRALRKDRTVLDKQVVMVKAYDPQQQFTGSYCFAKDISDRREIERLKDEFVSVVSHELRTPLTSISGALDLLANGVLQSRPEAAQRMLNIAASSTDRLVRLINDILDIERIESGKVTMTKQACDAARLIAQAVEVMQDIAERAGVSLVVVPLSVFVWADPDRIIQVLTNLLSNAIKFSPPGGTVWLTAEIKEAEVDQPAILPSAAAQPLLLFSVRDQGRGIPPDKLESIFGRFQQVDASDSRQKGGTGLGLAICRTILQYHGGQIWAESPSEGGSTFRFALPILPNAQHFQASSESNDSTHPLPHSTIAGHSPELAPLILVCDDDPSIRTVVQAMLERQNYRVVTAASGQETVEQAVNQPPDVILLNLMMPGMDGWDTLVILKQQPNTQNIPVIILSGLLPDAKKAPYPDINDWIVKPPSQQLLSQTLERALSKQSQVIKVLVIEDDLDLAEVLLAVFSRHGIQTFHASTGLEAIHLSQRIMPDLLVLDLALPGSDGFAVVDWLRQHNRLWQVPLVVYTARDLSDDDRQRLKLGQTLFLTKGRITPQEFERRVVDLLNRITRDKVGEHL
jgi:PAS domain S-box-containing protein